MATHPSQSTGVTPPGLWQSSGGPPGIGGGGPPAAGPPPGAGYPGGGPPAPTGAEGRELELQKEISSTIEAQVSRLIEQARVDTEAKVKVELGAIRKHMMDMDKRLDQLLASLDGMDPQEPTDASLDAEAVGQLLSKVEQQWGQEIRTLKQELHQTILAHNHNADLIKHHKDTIDALRDRCAKFQGGGAKTAEIQQQLQRIDQRLKQQQKQRKLEPLFERLAVLEQRVAAASTAAWRNAYAPPDPGLGPPGMGLPPGISQAMMPGMGMNMQGKGAGPKAGRPQGAAAQPKAQQPKAGAKYPSDEEVQARFKNLSAGSEASASSPPAEPPPPPPPTLGLEEKAEPAEETAPEASEDGA